MIYVRSSFSFLSIVQKRFTRAQVTTDCIGLFPFRASFKIYFIFAHIISSAQSLQSDKHKWIQQLAVSPPPIHTLIFSLC